MFRIRRRKVRDRAGAPRTHGPMTNCRAATRASHRLALASQAAHHVERATFPPVTLFDGEMAVGRDPSGGSYLREAPEGKRALGHAGSAAFDALPPDGASALGFRVKRCA